ncbi:MAG: HEAT repeat domain-containing protein, partial [Nostocaceae cyanobacterium]|nr:HEAT repeat domain-containing protein [Nostocaceae cyanobacterium]
AASALGDLGKDSEAVLQGLLGLLTDADSGVRWRAADALGDLGKDSEAVLQGLLGLLTDADSGVRSSAASALGKLGKNSPDFVTVIAQWIEQHQDTEYVDSGIDVLWELMREG